MLGVVRGVPPPAWIGSAGAAACTISHVEMPAFSATQPKMKPPRTCLARGNVSDSHPNPRKNITILSGSPEFRVSRSAHTSILCSTTRADSRSSSVRSERTAVLIVSGLSPDVTTPDIRHAFAPYAAVQVRHFFHFFSWQKIIIRPRDLTHICVAQDVRLIKERARREKYGEKSTFAFVDFASPEVAASVFSQTRGLSIRGNPVHINFSRGGGGRRGNRTARDKFEPERPLNLSDAFVFDHKTGHYFDKNSGFFYDPTSGLYYHGQTGVHYRWDAMRGSYLQVDSRGVAIQPGATHTNPHTNPQAAAQSTAQSATSETKVQGQSQISSSSHISSGPMPTGAPTPSPDPATDTTKSTTGSKGKDSSKPQRKKKRKRQLGAGVLINFSLGKKKKSRAAQQTPAATMQSPEDVAKMAAEAAAAAASASKALAGLPMASPPWASMAPRDNTHVTTVAPPTAQANPEILKPDSAAAPLAAMPVRPTDLASQSMHLAPTRRVCLLCKRKFSGTDKLFLHARQSALHRKNLELYAVKQATLAARAEHSQPPPRRDPKRRKNKYAKRPQAAASVDKPIDGANRGAKLLQKMGWKKGQGLGRTASGIVAPVSARTLARGAGLGSGDLGPLGGGYNDVATMARSRYNRAGVTDPVANAVANTPASGQPASAAANSYLTAMNQFRAESCRDDGDHRRAMLK